VIKPGFRFFVLILCCSIFYYGCMCVTVMFVFVFKEIGWEERLQNDVFYVGWDVKP